MATFGTIFQPISDLFSRPDGKQLPSLRKLNDSVYEFYSPPDGRSVSVEIIFFHGVERGDYSKAYVETWTSFLESTVVCWPQTLLAEQFRRARILSVSYDSSIKKGKGQGNLDLYCTAENLVQDLIDDAKVAATPRVPVVLVGKDFGGLVIKAICMRAKEENRSTFLSNLKGIFYYGTPHLGVENLPTAFNGALAERLKFGNNEIARLGSEFSKYRQERKWATRALLSVHTSEKVPELVISEASQRYDVDNYYTPKEGIDTVCKSQASTSSSFNFLTKFISRVERGKLMFESSSAQGLTEEGVGFKTSLGFGHDGNYVPMEKTLAKVKNALQEVRIVVLHGGPGSGKSSFARYLALQFDAGVEQEGTGVAGTCSAEQRNWLPNGVVYISCGKGANIISMQRELMRKFNIELPLLHAKSVVLEGAAELQKILHQELVEHLSKLQYHVVVVLDDVWDRDLVENLLVPWDQVRYLLTTQISTLWNAHDSQRVEMQEVTLEDARHILANYAKFEGGVISKDLQNLGDEIIEATGSHALALATLGNVLNNMERTVKDWQAVKDNLKEHLETKDYPPSSFGQNYSLSVGASMIVVLDLLDEDAKELLYNICLFDGPFIREPLVQLFLTCMLSRDKKISTNKSTMSLVAKGLVRIESETFGERDTNLTSRSVGDDMRVIWIHSLRQHFILTTKTEEISRITNFLDKLLPSVKRSNLDLAIALCALYGVDDIKRRAMQKMGSCFNEEQTYKLASAFESFVSLMLSKGDTKSPISQAATKVFLKFIYKRELDDDNICYLLKLTTCPSAQLATLRALYEFFLMAYDSIEKVKLIHEDHLCFVSAVLLLLDSRDNVHGRILEKTAPETAQIQDYAFGVFAGICVRASREGSTTIVLNVPHVLTVFVGSIQAKPVRQPNYTAVLALRGLCCLSLGASEDARLQICKTEGLLSGLVRSLSERSLSGHYDHVLHQVAAQVLGSLGHRNAEITSIICSTEGALAGLIKSLAAHDDHVLQEKAASALAKLACGDVDTRLKICNADGALAGLIKSLAAHDNHALQQSAARALEYLADGNVDTRWKICDAEGALAGLVRSLSAHYNPHLQASAARVLGNLGDSSTKFQWTICDVEVLGNIGASNEIGLKVCDAEGALAGLVKSLAAHDNHALQQSAARALRSLALGNVDMRLKICDAEGALAGLVRSLSAHYNPRLQEDAAGVLASLAYGNVDMRLKICNAEGALAGLIKALAAHDNHFLQQNAANALANLAWGSVDTQMKICKAEGALAGLIKALAAHDNHALQGYAAGALANLALSGFGMKLKSCAVLAKNCSTGFGKSSVRWCRHAIKKLCGVGTRTSH